MNATNKNPGRIAGILCLNSKFQYTTFDGYFDTIFELYISISISKLQLTVAILSIDM